MKPSKKRRSRTLRFLWWFAGFLGRHIRALFVVALFAALAFAYHLRTVDRLIIEKFDQPRQWNLPSRVFSDAEYLYPGLNIKSRNVIGKLDRLSYRNIGENIASPGDYALKASRLDLYLHDFDYAGENFRGFRVRFELANSVIVRIINLENEENLELVRIEPEMVATIFDQSREDRTLVKLEEVPQSLVQAIVAVEDNRFYSHSGVDPVGIARAAVSNLLAGRVVQGGSTLTQQLVKNYFLDSRRTFLRKMNEALIALRIESTHSKADILQAYLNEIYLGQRGSASIAGVQEAARYYFAKNVAQLNLAESALLAGIIRNPGGYNPYRDKEAARKRRDVVLAKMRDEEMISDEAYKTALKETIVLPKQRLSNQVAPYFIEFVKKQLADFYPQDVLETEGLKIFTTLDMSAQLTAEQVVSEKLAELEKQYGKAFPKDHLGKLQACLVAMTPANGYVRAMVGGRDYAETQFDRCVQAKRQPGSTFKPFVYLTAFDSERSNKPFTPASLIDDQKFTVQAGGKDWTPENYDHQQHGKVTLRRALEQSYNIATAKLAIDAGLDNVVQSARDAGISSPLLAVPALALGSFEVSPLEMASAYSIFPNEGVRAEPISIMNVVTKEGDMLERRQISMQRKFDAASVYLVTNMLKGVVDRGTAASARSFGLTGPMAGKTGTTSNYRDAWFAGFTPDFLSLVWVGFDDNAVHNLSGSKGALPIWATFMHELGVSGTRDFPSPKNVVLVQVDPKTGGLTSKHCPDFIYEAFIEGTEPDQKCEDIMEK